MSLIDTLSGGVVLVAFLHFALGRAGVSAYWRGVVAGAVPSFAILGYSLFRHMTLDRVSIHLAIYLATATVLSMIASSRDKNKSAGMHWSIKIMIVFFVILFIVDGIFVSVSTNGLPPSVAAWFLPNASKHVVYTGFTGVTRHDNNAAAAESRELKEVAELQKLGWKIEIDGVSHLQNGKQNDVTVKMADPQGIPVDGAQIRMIFLRSDTQAIQSTLDLKQVHDGEYAGVLAVPDVGNWILRTIITSEGNQVKIDRDVRVNTN